MEDTEHVIKLHSGTSLVIQGLRLCASTVRGMGSSPGWGTKILHAAWGSQKKKNDICSWSHNKRKEKWYSYCSLASSYQIWSKCSHSWSALNIPQAFTMYHHCSEFSTYLQESSCLTLTTAWKGKYHCYGCFTKKATQLQVVGLGFRCRQPGSRTVVTVFGFRSHPANGSKRE